MRSCQVKDCLFLDRWIEAKVKVLETLLITERGSHNAAIHLAIVTSHDLVLQDQL